MPPGQLRDAPDGLLECDSEGLGELPEGQDGDVVLGPFDASDVGAVDPTPEGEFFLRPAPSLSYYGSVVGVPLDRHR